MRLPLNAFLLREGAQPSRSLTQSATAHTQFWAWRSGRFVELGLERPAPSGTGDGSILLALFRRPTRAPSWQRFLEQHRGLDDLGGGGPSMGAVVYCGIRPSGSSGLRWIAWCFGSGSRILRRTIVDPRFGLLTALNTLSIPASGHTSGAGPRLRNVQYRVTAPYFQQAGHRAARDIPVEGFRLDTTADLLAAAGGPSSDSIFGEVLGGRSLRFRSDVNSVEDLSTLSDAAFRRWQTGSYRTSFGWVDNISPVYDESLLQNLLQELRDRLLDQPIPHFVDALLPDDLLSPDDDRSIQYIAYPGERATTVSRTTLSPQMLANVVRKAEEKGSDSGLYSMLRFLDSAHGSVGDATVLECIAAELSLGDQKFAVYDGDFYLIDPDFLARINLELDNLPDSEVDLPCYKGGAEGTYSSNLSSEDFVVLDRALLRPEGETPVEACDAIDGMGRLIHLKRKGKSSTFSHLCFQASSSCQLLRRSTEAREQLTSLIDGAAAAEALRASIRNALAGLGNGAETEVTFGLLGKWGERKITSLPLLSKIALMQTARRIRELGFTPSFARVDIC